MNRSIFRFSFSTIKNMSVYNWLPIAFYLANLYRLAGYSSLPYRLCIYLIGGLGLYKIAQSRRLNAMFVLTLLLYFFTELFQFFIIGNTSFTDVGADLFLFGIAFILLMYPFSYAQGIVSFYISFFYFLLMNRRGISTHFVLTSSGNYISVILILAATIYYVALQQSRRKMAIWDILPAFLCFSLSVWARGRGGILSTGILLASIILVYMFGVEQTNKKRLAFFSAVFIIFCIILLLSNFSVLDWFFSLGKWRSRGTNNAPRINIWSSYLFKTRESVVYFIFGAPLKDILVISLAGMNCHNSFLQLHAYNGIVMLLLILFLIIHAFWYYIIEKKWLFLSAMLAFCVRACTDKFVFGQYGLPLMLFFILTPFMNSDAEKK